MWLPAVLPAFRQGCSVALGICWKSGVAAEVIGLPVSYFYSFFRSVSRQIKQMHLPRAFYSCLLYTSRCV